MQRVYYGLHLALYADNVDGIDAFVHSDGVLPVVATAGILGVILNPHGLRSLHVALHHLLFHAPHLPCGSVLAVPHLLYAVAAEVSLR